MTRFIPLIALLSLLPYTSVADTRLDDSEGLGGTGLRPGHEEEGIGGTGRSLERPELPERPELMQRPDFDDIEEAVGVDSGAGSPLEGVPDNDYVEPPAEPAN